MSGEELRELMLGGQLPPEYATEENVRILLGYEREQMAKVEYYDMSVMIYCMNALIKRHQTDKELIKWWNEAVGNMQGTLRRTDKTPEETANAMAFIAKLTAQTENSDQLKEACEDFAKMLRENNVPNEELPLPVKVRKRAKRLAVLSRHLSAIMIAVIISVPVALIAFHTDVIENIVFFFRDEKYIDTVKMDVSVYDSLEEFEAARDISFLLPTWLPQDLEVMRVAYSEGSLRVLYSEDMAQLRINFGANMPDTYGEEIHKHDGIAFHISQEISTIWWEYGRDFYRLSFEFDISEYAVRIVENIK